MKTKFVKRKKLTDEIIENIVNGKLAIYIYAQIDEQDRPIQMVFPGKATLHKCYPNKNSYFEVVGASDKFYFKEYDYFWFVCENKPPEKSMTEAEIDDMLADPEAIPGSNKA